MHFKPQFKLVIQQSCNFVARLSQISGISSGSAYSLSLSGLCVVPVFAALLMAD